MTGDHEMERAEQLLRSVFTEHATGRTPPAGLAATVAARHRRHRRALVSAAAAAAVVVGAGIPTGLTLARSDRPVPAVPVASPRPAWTPAGPAPSGDACLPKAAALPAPVPVYQLPRQSGVRGSLGGNEAVVDRVLVAGWRVLGSRSPGTPAMDPRTARVVFVERAGPGVLALVTAFDRSRGYKGNTWVVGRDRWFVPTGGGAGVAQGPTADQHAREGGYLADGPDPLLITMEQVCGRWFGVVLASSDSTAVLFPASHIGADTRPVTPAGRPLPLTAGISVFPTDPVGREKVTVSRDGRPVATRQLNSSSGGPIYVNALVPDAVIARAAREGAGTPDEFLAKSVARDAASELSRATADPIAGVRVLWGGPMDERRRAVVIALMLPSGAAVIDSAVTYGPGKHPGYYGGPRGLVPAGHLDGVLGWQMPDGLVVVVAPAAARAEVVLFDNSVHPIPLTDGGGGYAAKPDWAKLIRAYRADGSLIGSVDPTVLLPQLPTTI